MANTMRWRYGDTSPVMLPVDATTVIEIGDLIFIDESTAKPASMAESQQTCRDKFAGVAMQASRNGDTQPIRVAAAGVFEFHCINQIFEVGKAVGVEPGASQTVTPVDCVALSIGRCAKRVNPASTSVLVDIVTVALAPESGWST